LEKINLDQPSSKNHKDRGTISRKPKIVKELLSRILRDYTFGNSLKTKKLSMMKLETQWILGFVDGEGYFYINIIKNQDSQSGFQVLPEFVVTQHQRDLKLLHQIKAFFGCGVVRTLNDNSCCYRVWEINLLAEKILPFFEKHQLKSMKKVDFMRFRKVVRLMLDNKHLTKEGLEEIRKIKAKEFKIESSPLRKEEGEN
jgi:hypothetical protein